MNIGNEEDNSDRMTPAKWFREEGRAAGREEGVRQNQIDNAQKMKTKGLSIADIAEITGLSASEIETLG